MSESIVKILETIRLAVGYSASGKKTTVMGNLNISAKRGDLVALIGRNGSGKSTLLRTLVALQPALGGSILINGQNLNSINTNILPKTVSFTSTEPLSVHNLKVIDAVSLGRFPYTNWIGSLTEDDEKSVNEALKATELLPLADRNIDNISDGERQRVLIARSLTQDTELMVMDEPTAFLDLPSRYSIVSLLRKLTREKGKCIIYSTHDLDTALSEADIIWLMNDTGIFQGAPEDHILNGALAHAFESPMLSFNQSTGSFSFIRKSVGEIALEATGLTKKLTEKALLRFGYRINPESDNKITVRTLNGNTEWCISKENDVRCFNTIYDLMNHLTDDTAG